jgi:hypothetical protein
MKLDSSFRWNDDENTVMAVLDTAIPRQRQMRGSSPRMTCPLLRHSGERL